MNVWERRQGEYIGQGVNALIVGVSGNLAQATPKERADSGLDWGYQKPLRTAQVDDIIERYHQKFKTKKQPNVT